ncbi:MAG: nucleotidyltransferase family protein [Paracoccaceae bacterium]
MTVEKPKLANGFGGVFPTGRLLPLIEAATISQSPTDSWATYREQLGSETPNRGETRLFPYIAWRIESERQNSDPLHADLVNECRRSKLSFVLEAEQCLEVQNTLADLDIAPVFLKGAALKSMVYPQPWLRRSDDIDVYLPREYAQAALDLLLKAGWQVAPSHRPGPTWLEYYLETAPSLTVQDFAGRQLDLHWVPRPQVKNFPELIERFQSSTQTVLFSGTSIDIPSSTWLLLETIIHGIRINEVYPLRWMLDAWLLMNGDDSAEFRPVNYPELFELATTIRVTGTVKAAFQGMLDAGLLLPEPAANWMNRAAPTLLERLEVYASLRQIPPVIWNVAFYTPDYFMRHPGSIFFKSVNLPRHLWKDVSGYQSFSDAASRIAQVVTKRK